MKLCGSAALFGALVVGAESSRTIYSLNTNWKFQIRAPPVSPTCADPTVVFPLSLNDTSCTGLSARNVTGEEACFQYCCEDITCYTYQYCPVESGCGAGKFGDCLTGPGDQSCSAEQGWIARGRTSNPIQEPGGDGTVCTDPACLPSTDDSEWRALSLPHDFIVEGVFNESADVGHGSLPYAIGFYRKHIVMPLPAPTGEAMVVLLEFEGIQARSAVFFNGLQLGVHTSGYTPSLYALPLSAIRWGGQDNVLAVQADATAPDGWWYDGGGMYRNAWLTIVDTPGPWIAPWGVYAGSAVTGHITWAGDGLPSASAVVTPSVEVWCNASDAAPQPFSLSYTVFDPSGANVSSSWSKPASVPGAGGVLLWNATDGMALATAQTWHLVQSPASPALYVLQTVLSVGGQAVDSVNVTFGIRSIRWDAATGFYLNGQATKIKGTANHQDFAGVGVAVPDRLQWHRVSVLKAFGVNGWRTAHNPPTPALLNAADALGMLVWDENHRNRHVWEIPAMVKRDRNHPSIIIWSLCNEAICAPTLQDWPSPTGYKRHWTPRRPSMD